MKGLKRLRTTLIAIAFGFLLTLVVPPFFQFFNKVDPWIMGLPFLLGWIVIINLGIALILLALWFIDKKLEGGDDA